MVFHIIDDNRDVCEYIVELLEISGYRARSYTDPVEYLNYVHSPDYIDPLAVFTDVQMPGMTGFELIAEIRAIKSNHKFILLSGYMGDMDESETSVCHFLAKPFQPNQLLEIVQAIDNCSEQGPSSASKSSCQSIIEDKSKECPLECRECGHKTSA